MRNTMAIAKREFQSYVNSPIPYILVTAYIATAGYMFFRQLFLVRQADMPDDSASSSCEHGDGEAPGDGTRRID